MKFHFDISAYISQQHTENAQPNGMPSSNRRGFISKLSNKQNLK